MVGRKGADVGEMLLRMDSLVASKPTNVKGKKAKKTKKEEKAKETEEEEEGESDSEESSIPLKKRKASKDSLKKPPGRPRKIAKAKVDSKGAKKLVKEKEVFDDKKVLQYAGKGYHPPRKFGLCTVYTSDEHWRLKRKPGDRTETKYAFGNKPVDQWKEMVKVIKKINKCS